eukprot:6043137-Amphidinium_carterae.2
MSDKSSASSRHLTQFERSQTANARLVLSSCQTPPRAALTALRDLSSTRAVLLFKCLYAWVLRAVSRPWKSGLFTATSATSCLAAASYQVKYFSSHCQEDGGV